MEWNGSTAASVTKYQLSPYHRCAAGCREHTASAQRQKGVSVRSTMHALRPSVSQCPIDVRVQRVRVLISCMYIYGSPAIYRVLLYICVSAPLKRPTNTWTQPQHILSNSQCLCLIFHLARHDAPYILVLPTVPRFTYVSIGWPLMLPRGGFDNRSSKWYSNFGSNLNIYISEKKSL